jgi:hypothetical protein
MGVPKPQYDSIKGQLQKHQNEILLLNQELLDRKEFMVSKESELEHLTKEIATCRDKM